MLWFLIYLGLKFAYPRCGKQKLINKSKIKPLRLVCTSTIHQKDQGGTVSVI